MDGLYVYGFYHLKVDKMADELYINCARNISLEGLIKLAVRDADCGDYLTCDNKNESLESLLKRAFTIDDDGDVALNVCGCGGGGGGGLTSVTYEELVALQLAAGFTPGAFYLLTDFATKHYFTDGSTTLTDINTGATEQLILFATAPSVLDSRVYSPTYPQDVIHYDWNPDNWLADYSFSSDQATIVPGWKGIITYRWDTRQDNSCYYDFRNVKFRRWAVAPGAWDAESTYLPGEWCSLSDVAYRTADTSTNEEPGSAGSWTALYDMTTPYQAWVSTSFFNGCPLDAEDFDDFYTFSDYGVLACFSNHIGENPSDVSNYYSRLNNIVFQNLGDYSCNSIEIGTGNSSWTVGTGNSFWTVGAGNELWTVGNGNRFWTVGTSNRSWTVGTSNEYWTVGNANGSWTVGAGNSYWTVGTDNKSWTVGNFNGYWTVGNFNSSWTVGTGNESWTVGTNNESWTVGNSAVNVTVYDGISSPVIVAYDTELQANYQKYFMQTSDGSTGYKILMMYKTWNTDHFEDVNLDVTP